MGNSTLQITETSYRINALKELTSNNVNYALIRKPRENEVDGDIDIIVHDISTEHMLLIKLGYLLYKKSERSTKYLKYINTSNSWIHLDVHEKIFFGKLYTSDTFESDLLNNKYLDENNIYRIKEKDEIILTLLHVVYNKNTIDPEYQSRFDNFNLDIESADFEKYSFLPFEIGQFLNTTIDSLIQFYSKKHIEARRNFKIFNKIIIRIYNRINSTIKSKGAIVFLGPDGSGKSSLISAFSSLNWPRVKNTYMGPTSEIEALPIILQGLIFFDDVRRNSKHALIRNSARIGWHITCFIDFYTRLIKNLWFLGSNGVVFYDRYPYDMYFRKPTRFNEWIYMKFFPKPSFVFLCAGDSEIIYSRKLEGENPIKVQKTIELYRSKLNLYNIPYFELNTTKNSLENNVNLILNNLIRILS